MNEDRLARFLRGAIPLGVSETHTVIAVENAVLDELLGEEDADAEPEPVEDDLFVIPPWMMERRRL